TGTPGAGPGSSRACLVWSSGPPSSEQPADLNADLLHPRTNPLGFQADLLPDLPVGEAVEKQVHDPPIAFVQLGADVLVQRAPADLRSRGRAVIRGVVRPGAAAASTGLEADGGQPLLLPPLLLRPVDDRVARHPAQPPAQARSRFLVGR